MLPPIDLWPRIFVPIGVLRCRESISQRVLSDDIAPLWRYFTQGKKLIYEWLGQQTY
jgi:hypothetical protein